MKDLGYDLVSDKDGYLKYQNEPGLVVPGYGKMFKNKRIIYFNCTYVQFSDVKNIVFTGIQEDGDTRRNVFNGVVDSQETLKLILNSVR